MLTVLFHSGLFCDYQSKGHCKFFKSPWKVYFSSLWAEYGRFCQIWSRFVFWFQFSLLFLIQIYFKTLSLFLIIKIRHGRLYKDKFWMIHKGWLKLKPKNEIEILGYWRLPSRLLNFWMILKKTGHFLTALRKNPYKISFFATKIYSYCFFTIPFVSM